MHLRCLPGSATGLKAGAFGSRVICSGGLISFTPAIGMPRATQLRVALRKIRMKLLQMGRREGEIDGRWKT